MEKQLKDAIIKQQGDLLYTTFAEECSEVIQALSKIKRKQYYQEDYLKEVDNLLEEINDVLINIELIKEQVSKDSGFSMEYIEKRLQEWNDIKINKISKIFLS